MFIFNNKLKFVSTIFVVVLFFIILLLKYPLVIIKYPIKYNYEKIPYTKGQLINPLKNFDFSKGNWKVYVVFKYLEMGYLPKNIPKTTCLVTDDISLLQKMQKDWNFKYTNGDMATVEDKILFYRNGELVFYSEIHVGRYSEGLQSQQFGFLVPIKKKIISKYLSEFKKSKQLIIVL